MDSNILYLNCFVIFILSLIVVSILITKKENPKARLSFCFFFLNIILVCFSNLITYYYGNYHLVFIQFSITGFALLYGPMLLQYVYFTLEQKLPKYWSLNYWIVLLVFVAGLYYLFIPDELQKQYFDEMIQGNHTPTAILNNLVLFHSVFYFIYLRIFLNKFKVSENDIQLTLRKEWVSDFVNYMIFCNVIFIFYYIIATLFYAEYIVFGDLVIVPIIILAIYSFIVIKSSQKHKEAEYKYVLSHIENQNELLQQRLSISRDLHDNIGSQLTFILSSVENIQYAHTIEDAHLGTKLNTIGQFAKETIVELRDTVWALKSNEMLFEDLEMRVNDFIAKAKMSNEAIQFSFVIDEKLRAKKLSSIEGMNIYRVLQEAVHNAFKHAQARQITIAVSEKENQLLITIKDDGIGFDSATIVKGNGLNNMKKRIQQIGGQFILDSNSQGTKVEIRL
ncbi:sensor histidine kinase [Flavobacterium faecale]|uniref:sensor histidine kinase n=1 Tax=Flavobacterium faecale TaxID=1355330 RepID=UPI003AAFDB3D